MFRSLSISTATLVATAAIAVAQPGPAVRQLGSVVATASETFGPTVTLRHTAQGVLVNDILNRRLMLLDGKLSNAAVVADSTPATANAYSSRVAGLIAYKSDSSLFIDPQSMSMLVIDGAGKVARVMAIPGGRDGAMIAGAIGGSTYDGKGRLIYRGMPQIRMGGPPPGGGAPGAARGGGGGGGGGGRDGGGPMFMGGAPEIPDTSPILRINLESRVVDTLGWTKMVRPKVDIVRDEATGNMSVNMTMNPLPTIDEFAVLSDGSVALIRGHDYHVDFVRPDGSRESSGKMPHDWQRLSDEDKVAFIDSLKAARERFLAANPQPQQPLGQANQTTTTGPGGATQTTRTVMIGGAAPAGGGGGNPMAGLMNNRNMNFVPANELPDYKPPFFAGAARADMDGNLWVQTIPTKATAGGPIYDVINGKGELVDRVQVPRDRLIAGFGAGGVVYLTSRDGQKTKLERASLK